MGIGTDSAWEKWGSRDPYYGVVSFEEFRKDHINDNKERFFDTGNQEIERVLARLKSHFGWSPKGKALDLGSGVGRLSFALARYFDEVHGFDISPSMIAEAAANRDMYGQSAVDFRLSDDRLTKADDSYDFVMSFIVLQHIPVRRGMILMETMVDKLKPGGAFMFHFSVRNWSLIRAAMQGVKGHMPLGQKIANLIALRPISDPGMEMNDYSVGEVQEMLFNKGITTVISETERHGPILTISISGVRPTT